MLSRYLAVCKDGLFYLLTAMRLASICAYVYIMTQLYLLEDIPMLKVASVIDKTHPKYRFKWLGYSGEVDRSVRTMASPLARCFIYCILAVQIFACLCFLCYPLPGNIKSSIKRIRAAARNGKQEKIKYAKARAKVMNGNGEHEHVPISKTFAKATMA